MIDQPATNEPLYRRPLNGAEELVSRMGSGKLGAEKYGAAGAGITSTMVILSQEVSGLLAREMGCTTEQATRFLYAFGRVAQRMLLNGKPVGLPHLGLLALYNMRRKITCRANLAKAVREGMIGKHKTATQALEMIGPITEDVNEVRFVAPRSMHRFFKDNAVYNGHWRLHFVEACRGHKHITHAKTNLRHHDPEQDHMPVLGIKGLKI